MSEETMQCEQSALTTPPAGAPADTVTAWRRHNTRRIREWLYYYVDIRHLPGAQSTDSENTDPNGPAARVPLTNDAIARLDDPEIHASHRVLEAAASHLKQRNFGVYQRLYVAYFADDPNPTYPDIWASEAEHNASVPDRLALKQHEAGIEFIREFVEAELPKYRREDNDGHDQPMLRLKLGLPHSVYASGKKRRTRRRRRALEAYLDARQGHPKPRAVRIAATRSGYSEKEIRVIIRREEAEEAERVNHVAGQPVYLGKD